MRQNRHFFELFEKENLFQNQKHRIVQSPKQKCPVCAVPEAGECPDDENIQYLPGQAAAVAAEGDIEIITEPCAERHMPAPPEFRDALRDVRIIEVLQKLKAEHPPETDGHIRVAGKIKVELERKGERAEPRSGKAQLRSSGIDIPERADVVGEQYLLPETNGKPLHAGGKLFGAETPRAKLGGHVLIPDDRPGDQLWEERDKCAEADKVFLFLRVASVNVDRIGHRLERVEGNADRQREPERGDAYAGNAAERRGEQIEVFEENEQREVDNGIDRQNGPRFFIVGQPIAGDEESGSIVQRDGEYHQQDVHRLAPAVKHEIYDKKPEIPIARRHDIIYRQYDRQINKQEKNA